MEWESSKASSTSGFRVMAEQGTDCACIGNCAARCLPAAVLLLVFIVKIVHKNQAFHDFKESLSNAWSRLNKAYFLYLTQNLAEQGKLLKKGTLNCRIDGATFYPCI